MSTLLSLNTRAYVLAAVLALAIAVWVSSAVQRGATDRAFQQTVAAQRMLTAMLDQESGLRGFQLTGREEFVIAFDRGRDALIAASQDARVAARGDDAAAGEVARLAAIADRWHAQSEASVARVRRLGPKSSRTSRVLARARLMRQFRASNVRFQDELDDRRRAELARAGYLQVAIILVLGGLFAGAGLVAVRRNRTAEAAARREREEYRVTQQEFAEAMQLAESDGEAYELIVHHVRRSIPGAEVTVLRRNSSEDRLEAVTPLREGSPLAAELRDAEPRSCLAMRFAREQSQGVRHDPLLGCGLCGKTPAASCEPLLVGGEVIGSVLVEHRLPLAVDERRRLHETVTGAAPVLANLRNLALAETRAATDALTGLANRRALDETLERMLAQAGRTLSPLALVLLDLDHFKSINDTYGHDQGDQALAAVGDTLSATVRASDFAARSGGEEFVALLPNTDLAGGLEAAEKMRLAIEGVELPGIERRLTASFGVAVFPADATDPAGLLRLADRALYAAKRAGRNRVESAIAGAAG